jgi:hypothetical protein
MALVPFASEQATHGCVGDLTIHDTALAEERFPEDLADLRGRNYALGSAGRPPRGLTDVANSAGRAMRDKLQPANRSVRLSAG